MLFACPCKIKIKRKGNVVCQARLEISSPSPPPSPPNGRGSIAKPASRFLHPILQHRDIIQQSWRSTFSNDTANGYFMQHGQPLSITGIKITDSFCMLMLKTKKCKICPTVDTARTHFSPMPKVQL